MSFKGPKRKRLAKACDACHKSKRRCDGTSPCSNCYFASKECSYTDAAGRPVPAPCLPHPSSTSSTAATASSRQQLPSSTGSSSSQSGRTRRPPPPDVRKRPRVTDLDMDGIDGSPSLPPPPLPPPPLVSPAAGPEVDGDGLLAVLDPHVVRELVSLFFAHLYPMRLIFHMPTFFAALASGRIPAYLVHAVCAIAAPIYPDRPRGSAPRNVGTNHAAAARKLMYDSNGVFRAPRDLASVQALCLLQNHEHVAVFPWALSLEYFDLASQILRDDLRVHDPSGGLFPDALSRECARRCAWYIRFMYINHLAYHSVPIPPPEHDTAIPLPADEASFDMAVLNHASPDFLHQTPTAAVAAPPGAVPSELGMVLRISECFYAIGRALDKTTDDPRTLAALENVVADLERRIGAWEAALPAGMRYTEDSLRTHKLMYGTAANSSAWSFFFANLTHAGTALGIAFAKRRLGRSMDVSWARPRLNEIMATLGHLATLNIIAAAVIYACDKYASEGTDPRWTYELDVTWGSKFPPVSFEPQARDRTSPSPPESSHDGSPAQASAAPPRSTSSYFRTLSDQFALARAPTTSSASASQTPRAGPPNFSYSLALVDAPADLYASASAPPPAPLSSSSAMRRLQIESFSGSSRAASDAQSVSGQSLPSLKESGLLDCDRPGRGAQLLQPAPPVLGLMAGAGQPPRGLGWLGEGGGGGGPASIAVSEPRWRESVWEAGSRC